ncbi:CHMP3, partial [Symbiodinium pilosum]
ASMGNGKSKEETVKEKAREWQRQIRGESRRIDRDISRMRQEEEKLKKEIKTMAEKGQAASVKTLARQVVRSRAAVARLERTKCSMSAVNLHLTTAVASMSTASALKMSSGVMKEMNRLMNVPELQRTMEDMRQEMMRAEIADEMMEEGFQESDDETEIDSAVARVYEELALDKSQLLDT